MLKPMTELPDDDAPLREWLRPVSATMLNKREAIGHSGSDVSKGHGGGASALVLKLRKAMKAKRDG